jgi:transglutaminase-like putative cysteine protease
MEWKTIDSAPKDGTEILLFNHAYLGGDTPQQVVGHWATHGWRESYADEYAICEATHWMPLPPPPSTT